MQPKVNEVLVALREYASRDVLDQMGPRYGIHTSKAVGVSMANMKAVAKQFGPGHQLAAALWETQVYEARIVAALIDEPGMVTADQMDRWCAEFDNWAICDTVCFALFDRAPDAWTRLEPWARDEAEFVRRASFALLWSLALHDKAASDEQFLATFDLIEQFATDERPLVTKSISMALRAVGKRNEVLRQAVLAAATRLSETRTGPASRIGRTALRDFG